MMNVKRIWLAGIVVFFFALNFELLLPAQEKTTSAERAFSPAQQAAVDNVVSRSEEINSVNKAIWEYAEIGLQEHQSSALLIEKLKRNGFEVQTGVSNMPTAFVASYGHGKPVIGVLAEYDALPDLSQVVDVIQSPVTPGGAGHACGHSGLGAAALGAALAVKDTLEKHNLPGTIRLYGTPAEETAIGKVYMALDGQFDDLDVCLHWHPSTANGAWGGSSKAVLSVKFTFKGVAAHASTNPHSGCSALDAVELMNVGVNYMREHVKNDVRIHYVITNGGGQPNVVPPEATVWYYIRADRHEDVEKNFQWVQDIARGASLMTKTTFDVQIETDCHEVIVNHPLAEAIDSVLRTVERPKYSAQEHAFARSLQATFSSQPAGESSVAISEGVRPPMLSTSTGSTDVGDVSWKVPTGGFRAVCFVSGSPGHSWQNVASVGSPIGEKGIVYAAQVLAATAVRLFEDPILVSSAKADFDRRMKNRQYKSLIPEGQTAPSSVR
jgi:aminobenzoyl-glutamate utilization protein B